MKKNVIVGIVILLAVVGGALFWQLAINKKPITVGKLEVGGAAVVPEYTAKPADIAVTGFGGYKLDKVSLDGEEVPVIRVPVVTWGGYAALFAANGNKVKPNKDSLFYKNAKFAVEIVREENPQVHVEGFAQGKNPIIWTTMDTLPILYHAMRQDKRVVPQVFGVFDWSFGGDGIIVRGNVKTPKDLKGKKVVTAGNTPSNFFLLWLLSQSGLSPSEVNIQYVADAITAKDAFVADRSVDACVTWSPFLYEITDPASKAYVDGSRLLITSRDANQLIADVYATRLDFLKEHPEIVKGFSKSMLEGVDAFAADRQATYRVIAETFQLPGGAHEAELMLGDVHIANFPEMKMFFDPDNSISAYKIFFLAQEYYKGIGSLPDGSSYDAENVISTAALEEWASKKLFASQKNTLKDSFNSASSFNIADLESRKVVLAEDIQIYFEAQRIDFNYDLDTEEIRRNRKELKEVAEQMAVLGTTVVKLVGHLDTTRVEDFKKQGNAQYIEAASQARLVSKRRAEFIKKVLVEKYGCDAMRIVTEGKGWEQPIDPVDQAKNRRVEVRFISLE